MIARGALWSTLVKVTKGCCLSLITDHDFTAIPRTGASPVVAIDAGPFQLYPGTLTGTCMVPSVLLVCQ
jgi:hypothetical protein